MSGNKRLQILSHEEVAELYAKPQFNATERIHYFSLPKSVVNKLNLKEINRKSISKKLYFVLLYGYFKAKHQFFILDYSNIKKDVKFIMDLYFPNDKIPTTPPSQKTQRQVKSKILQLMGFDNSLDKIKTTILKKANQLAKVTQNHLEIFDETIKFLEVKKLVLPSYSLLQDTIGAALKNEDKRLIKMVKRHMTKRVYRALSGLLKKGGAFYNITELKFDARSFQTNEIQTELKKLEMCKSIYDFAKYFLPKLVLSRHLIGYYSDLAKLYSVAKLQKIPRELSYLYLICYVQNRCERITNNLVQAFIYYVDKYRDEEKKYAKENLPIFISQFDQHKEAIGKLMGIYTDKRILTSTGDAIQRQAYVIMPEEKIIEVSQSLLSNTTSRKKKEQQLRWQFHKNNYQAILINLRPLFLAIDFGSDGGLKNLFKASKFLRSLLGQKKKTTDIPLTRIPIAHIKPKSLLSYFTETIKSKKSTVKKVLNHYQYEFYLYRALRENLRKSKVHVNSSTDYKSFEEEVKIDPDWHKKEKKILKDLNNNVLLTPIDTTLTNLEEILEPLITRTNKRALNGDNKHIKITWHKDGSVDWKIPYPKKNIEIDNPFYDQLELKTISEVFDFVEQKCGFIKAFFPLKLRSTKTKKDYLGIKATILANGTMQGTYEFSRKSNLKYQRLQTTEKNCIRLETLRNAADIIIDHMVNLPIFDSYHLSSKRHGNIDGTKKKTRRRVLKARHSPKYFGLDVGIVIMTMCLNHVPFVTDIIGANEYEGNFSYPMMRRNSSIIDPDIISTDTAGTNNVNDFLYYLVGKIHAPCYRSLVDKTKTICGFKPLTHYKNLLIQPSKTVNKKLIEAEWPKLVPILVSLLSHETNQKNIIKMLGSHEYKSDIKDALWDLNNILKSIHILKYIDDPVYRQDIRTALNRGEAYHQLIDKITAIGGSDFRGMTELEIEIWNECTRLIALIVIYYNMYLLSKLYEIERAKDNKEAIEYLKHISPVASQHINIGGLYEFSETMANVNVDSVIKVLSKILDDALIKEQSVAN